MYLSPIKPDRVEPRGERALRVCHIIGHLRFGGAERQVVNIARHMARAKSYIVCLGEREHGGLSGLLPADVEVVWMGVRARYAPYHVGKLARRLRSMAPDVVHTHMFWANVYGVLAATLAAVPAIVTCEHGRNPWKRRWHYAIERHIVSPLANRRVCVSPDILRVRRDVDGVPASKLLYIPNGTEMGTPVVSEPAGCYTFGTVGRLVEAKDYPTLIRAIGLLRDKGYDVELYIVGDGPERNRLEAEISALRLASIIHIVGFQDDIHSWLRRFHIFVLSSLREGQPMALLEAMALGLPIVATHVGGIPDTIAAGSEGLLVAPGDPVVLAEAMEALILDERRRTALGKSAYARCRADFSIQSVSDRYMELYRSILDQFAGRRSL
ncbi:MAG: glycosyltransferase [Gammaproteobacteria bacterium]